MTQQVQFGDNPSPQAAPNQPTVDDSGNLLNANDPAPAPEPAPESRPEWLPENFQSPEDLAKSYKEAQAEITRLRQGGEEPPEEEKPSDSTAESTDTGEGITFEEAVNEWMELGQPELSEEDYSALGELGYSRDFIDTYHRGLQADQDAAVSAVHEITGGQEQYDAITQWGASNLSSSEVKAFNKVMDSGSKEEVAMAVRGLKAQYNEARGNTPGRSVTGGNPGSNSGGYQSLEQQIQAQSDPRYQSDSAYRSDVEAKIRNSNFW